MKSIFSTLFLLLITPFFIIAQSVKWGDLQKHKAKLEVDDFYRGRNSVDIPEVYIYQDPNSKHIYNLQSDGVLIEYTADLKQIKKQAIDFKKHLSTYKKIAIQGVLPITNKMVIMIEALNQKQQVIIAQEIELKTLSVENPPVILGSYSREKSSLTSNRLNTNYDVYDEPSIIISSDRKSFAIIVASDKIKGNETCFISVYDNELTKKWVANLSFPYSENPMQIQSCALSNGGKVYLSGNFYKGSNSAYRQKPQKSLYKLFEIADGKLLKEYELSNEEQYCHSMRMDISDETLILAGHFSSRKTKNGYGEGYRFFKLNTMNQTVLADKLALFDEEKFNFLVTKQQQKLKEKGKNIGPLKYRNISLKGVEITKDGGAMLIGEHLSSRFVQNGPSVISYGRIIITRLSDKGEVIWHKSFSKNTQHINRDYGLYSNVSFAYKMVDNILYCYYNEIEDYLDYSDNYTKVVCTSITNTGEEKRKVLHKKKAIKLKQAQEGMIVPYQTYFSSDKNTIIFYVQYPRLAYKLGIVQP